MINRNVFVVTNILTLACLGSLALDAHAEGRATSSFRYPEAAPGKRVDTHQGLLEYVISNVGDEPIYIQNEMHPITSKTSARLMGDSLSVVAPDGTEAPYQGSTVTLRNRGPLPSTRIAPGETKVYLLDIQKSYIIQPGVPYIVSLKNGGIFTVPSVGKQSAVRTYDSNVATVLIDEGHYIRPRTKEEIIEYQRAPRHSGYAKRKALHSPQPLAAPRRRNALLMPRVRVRTLPSTGSTQCPTPITTSMTAAAITCRALSARLAGHGGSGFTSHRSISFRGRIPATSTPRQGFS
jgi:hypothetical protein